MSKNNRINTKTMLRLLTVALFYVVTSVLNISHAKTLKVCYDQWPPMTIFPSGKSSDRGVVIDMLEHIYQAKGYQLEYFEVPLARGLDMVAEGLCDLLPEYLYSKHEELGYEYAKQATFSYQSAFVIRRDSEWRYNGIQSIQGKRIATGPGWDYSSMSTDYQAYIDDPNNANFVEIIAGNDDVLERVFRMINAGRVDIYADNELVLQYVLNGLNWEHQLMVVRPGLEKKLVEIPIFSKNIPIDKRQELIEIWDQGRIAIKGEQQTSILKKYNVSLTGQVNLSF